MLSLVDPQLDAYCENHTTPLPDVVEELAAETRMVSSMSIMMVGPLQGRFLNLLARMVGARRILEIGTFTGYSALAMASALPDDGELITCDVNEETTTLARKYWSRAPEGDRIDLKLGPALESLDSIEGPLDMVFIDADKDNQIDYWERVVPMVRAGGIIVVDNVLMGGSILFPADHMAIAVAEFNDHVANDDRVINIMLPIRDGITVAYRL